MNKLKQIPVIDSELLKYKFKAQIATMDEVIQKFVKIKEKIARQLIENE